MNIRIGLLMIIAATFSVSSTGQEVAVDAVGQLGTAVLRPFFGNCYAITAFHVVANSGSANLTDINRQVTVANVVKSYPQVDLAILEIRDNGMCSTARWPADTSHTQNIVHSAGANGTLVRTAASGSTAQIPVSLISLSNGQFSVLPSQTIPIVSGWSCSGLYVNSVLVGILINVDTRTGRGTVLPADYVDRITSDFFHVGGQQDPFDLSVQSQNFHDKMSAVIQSLSNNLERFNTNQHVIGASFPTYCFQASIGLPGFNQPSTIDFHNDASYTKPIKLEKLPLRIDFLQTFPDSSDSQFLTARFNAVGSVIENIIPGWTNSPLGHGINPLRDLRNEYRNGTQLVSVNLWSKELQVEVSR
jgi:S1-C subfamily serine protease